MVEARVILRDGTELEMTFDDYEALSAWTAEHHDELESIRAKADKEGTE